MTTRAPIRERRLTEEFRDRLAWARLRLARTVATTDDDLEAIATHECRDIAEEPGTGTVGGLLARLRGPARAELGEIEAAQARLAAGTFGACETCRRPIPLARLRATPSARHCPDCASEPRVATRAVAKRVGVAGLLVAAALLVAPAAAQEPGDGLVGRGREAFAANGCYGCHMVGKAGTPIGPELSHVGARYTPEYLARWLRDPALQRPSSHMPALELSERDVSALAAYLSSLR
ncbi:MAG TPA: c-type cytochrome [Methylomirabilota bacterium]